jgi:hypothetical protein
MYDDGLDEMLVGRFVGVSVGGLARRWLCHWLDRPIGSENIRNINFRSSVVRSICTQRTDIKAMAVYHRSSASRWIRRRLVGVGTLVGVLFKLLVDLFAG